MNACKVQFPLLIKTNSGLSLSTNHFKHEPLSLVFENTILVDWNSVPTSYVPFDAESPLSELAEGIIPAVLSLTIAGGRVFGAKDVAGKLIPLWISLGNPAKNQLRSRIADILQLMGGGEFRQYFRWQGGSRNLSVEQNPWHLTGRQQTSAVNKLHRAAESVIRTLQQQENGEGGGSSQLQLI